jgi:hypothetical protein
MQSMTRPSPGVTLPQNLLMSTAQALRTFWTAAATRSLRPDCADALVGSQISVSAGMAIRLA